MYDHAVSVRIAIASAAFFVLGCLYVVIPRRMIAWGFVWQPLGPEPTVPIAVAQGFFWIICAVGGFNMAIQGVAVALTSAST